ncbi:hypothetical protein ACFL3P_01520 [Pseudomonadota bacterium]
MEVIKKYPNMIYIATVILIAVTSNVYLLELASDAKVSTISIIAGPMFALHLIILSGWKAAYAITLIVGFLLCGYLWFLTISNKGVKALISSIIGIAIWLGSGSFLLGISYYG